MPLSKIKCFLLDLDGTVYIGGRLIDGAKEAIERMRARGSVLFLTNNSSVSRADYLIKLNNLGLNVDEGEIYTSGLATINYLKSVKRDSRVFLLGTDSLKCEFLQGGIGLADEDGADTVVLAFDTELTYKKLLSACRLIERGAYYVATHPDLVCPAPEGNMPDAGSITALIRAATGRSPDVVCGKPFKPMAEGIKSLVNCAGDEIIMYGDRLSTDMKFALNNGFRRALVLSGEATEADFKASGLSVDYVLDSIALFDKE